MFDIEDFNKNPKQMSPLTLAFLGDAVFELLVRQSIVAKGSMPVGKLHRECVKFVCAKAQSGAMDIIMDSLTEEELDIFKRGRNATSATVPKNADPADYRRATGLEALMGFLYLKGDFKRIDHLFKMIISPKNESC